MPPPIGGLGVSKAPQGDKPVFASTRFNESSQLCSAPDGQAERTDTTVTGTSGVLYVRSHGASLVQVELDGRPQGTN